MVDLKSLVIIDAYSLLYRAFYATRYLSTSDGRPTNALYGFSSMIFGILESLQPHAIFIALDAPGKTFRHDGYAEYKGTRKETPPELKLQFPVVRKLIQAFEIPTFELVGFEADDVIGTLSLQAEQNGYKTTIVTGDLDSLQLVDHAVRVMVTKKGITDTFFYTPETVQERYGFSPQYITDFKALVGDSSDNILGVPGIGEKTATKIIQKHGTIEEILKDLNQLDPKLKTKIEPHQEQVKHSKWLATIDRNVPLTCGFEPYKIDQLGINQAKQILEDLEFKSLIRRFEQVTQPYRTDLEIHPEIQTSIQSLPFNLVNPKDIHLWIADEPFAIVSTLPIPDNLFDTPKWALAKKDEVVLITQEEVAPILQRYFSLAIIHDAKPLYKLFSIPFKAPFFDTALAAYLLQSDRSTYVLEDLIHTYLDCSKPTQIEQKAVGLYEVSTVLKNRLRLENQFELYETVERPLLPILSEMEQKGILISVSHLQEFSKSLENSINQITQQIYELAGEEFLIGSPKQLGEILFNKLNIPGGKKNKTGYATGAEILQSLSLEYPICAEVINWRELSKLKSTYADALPRLVQTDKRIHTSFNQMVAATGRLSSSEPNLQNIPIRTELGRQIRRAFISSTGYQLASFDYSQIELRLLAHLSQDPNLTEAFLSGQDIHSVTAGLMFYKTTEDVSSHERRLAKMLNYAVLYGVTEFGLLRQLGSGFSMSEAKQLISQYYERFPNVKDYLNFALKETKEKGFSCTLSGRRRFFPEIHSANRLIRQYAERQAMNAPIQGSAADMAKIAMIHSHQLLKNTESHLLLQVHDELLFEIKEGEESLLPKIHQVMVHALKVDVPIEVDLKIGINWNDMTPHKF